jgi:hypothetical protein
VTSQDTHNASSVTDGASLVVTLRGLAMPNGRSRFSFRRFCAAFLRGVGLNVREFELDRATPGLPIVINATFILGDVHMTNKLVDKSVTISQSTITGSFASVIDSENVTITNRVGALQDNPETATVASAFRELQAAINDASDLDEKKKAKLLEALSTLSKQAATDKDDRTEWSVKGAFEYLHKTISIVGTLSTIWRRYGNTIGTFFGLTTI